MELKNTINPRVVLPNREVGRGRHGRWKVGDKFSFDGNHYQFFGASDDHLGTLHALRLHDNKFVTFSASNEWEAV